MDMHNIMNEFEFRPDRTTNYGVSCPWASKKYPYRPYNGENGVSTFSLLFLIESFWYFHVTRTRIKAWMSLNFLKWDLTLAHWTQVSDRCPLGYLFLNLFTTNGWILIKFCICTDKYKINVAFNALFFFFFFFFFFFCCCCFFFFYQFLTALGPLSTSEFYLCSISCELICWFRSNSVYALILTRCRLGWLKNIFRSFLTELWSLIDVVISFILNILWTNWWILIKFCKCIDINKI